MDLKPSYKAFARWLPWHYPGPAAPSPSAAAVVRRWRPLGNTSRPLANIRQSERLRMDYPIKHSKSTRLLVVSTPGNVLYVSPILQTISSGVSLKHMRASVTSGFQLRENLQDNDKLCVCLLVARRRIPSWLRRSSSRCSMWNSMPQLYIARFKQLRRASGAWACTCQSQQAAV